MTKFAFANSAERTALLRAATSSLHSQWHVKFLRMAAGIPIVPTMQPAGAAQANPAVEERLQQLREFFQDFLTETNLITNPSMFKFVEQITQKMKPVLEQSLRGQQSLEDQMKQIPKMPKAPGQQQDIANERDLSDKGLVGRTPVPMATRPPVRPIRPIHPAPRRPVPQQVKPAQSQWSLTKEGNANMQKTYDQFVQELVEIANAADEAGLIKQADRLAEVTPALKTLKTAQYEGPQNYWIANGRAFEKAYREKRVRGDDPAKFRSPNEVWWEILEEYNAGLLGPQSEFVAKYASKEDKHDVFAGKMLMKGIVSRMVEGSAPGVAVYETIEHLASGGHEDIVAAKVSGFLTEVADEARKTGNEKLAVRAETLLKEAGVWDWMKGGLARMTGLSEPQRLASQISAALPQALGALQGIQQKRQSVPYAYFERIVHPIMLPMTKYMGLWDQAGWTKPKQIDLNSYVQNGVVSPEGIKTFRKDMEELNRFAFNPQYALQLSKDLQAIRAGKLQPGTTAPRPAQEAAAPVPAAGQATTAPAAPAGQAPATPAAPAGSPAATAPATPATGAAIPPPTAPDKNTELRNMILKDIGGEFKALMAKGTTKESDITGAVARVLNKHLPSPVAAPGAVPIMSRAPAAPVPTAPTAPAVK